MLTGMKQSSLDLNLSTKKTRKQELLAQMDRVVPWAALVELIAPYYPEGKNGRPPFALEAMLRVHCMQQWFTLSDLAMEEAFFDTPIYREFAGLDAHGRMPDESTILRFRHRLEKHRLAEQILATVNDLLAAQGLLLKAGTAVDATLIAAPSSTLARMLALIFSTWSMSASMGFFSLSSSLRLPGRIATCQVTSLLASGRLCAPW